MCGGGLCQALSLGHAGVEPLPGTYVHFTLASVRLFRFGSSTPGRLRVIAKKGFCAAHCSLGRYTVSLSFRGAQRRRAAIAAAKPARRLNAEKWRRDRDSNPGNCCQLNGFRDRPVRPLRHLSAIRVQPPGDSAKAPFVPSKKRRNFLTIARVALYFAPV